MVVVPDPTVVVVAPTFVVEVVVVRGAEVVVVLETVVVLVVVVVLVGAVVLGDVVGTVVGVVVVGDDGVKMFPSEGPFPVLPKIEASGLSAISSTTVMNTSATAKTIPAVVAMAFHVNRNLSPPTRSCPPRTTGVGTVLACRCSDGGASAAAEISRPSVAPTGAAADSISVVSRPTAPTISVGAASCGARSTVDAAPPAAPVPPMRRSKVEVGPSGTRTTTCFTALCPRSIDCDTKVVPRVAAMEPIATPTIVPVTPKLDAMSAAITAPAAEARICRKENFTPGRRN